MKLSNLIFVATLSLSQIAIAESDHSADVCSVANELVCAHLGHMKGFSTTEEAQFMFHAFTPDHEQMTNLKLELWMPKGDHGSSQVEMNQVALNKYHVTKAFFVMKGDWIVRANFDVAGASHTLEIPVSISK